MARSPAVVSLLLLCLLGRAACDETLVKCVKPELRACYCGKTTYDRQELYAVNCTGTGLDPQRSRDVFVNLPDETEVRPGRAVNTDFFFFLIVFRAPANGTGVNRAVTGTARAYPSPVRPTLVRSVPSRPICCPRVSGW